MPGQQTQPRRCFSGAACLDPASCSKCGIGASSSWCCCPGAGLGPCCPPRGCCVLKTRGFCRAVCSRAVGVLGLYQWFLFLIRLFSILKARDPFMAQGGKPVGSLTLRRGGCCCGAEVQGADASWDVKRIPRSPRGGRRAEPGQHRSPGLTHTAAVRRRRLLGKGNCSRRGRCRGRAGCCPGPAV